MPTDVIMPQMGESIFEGTITKWLKKAGDSVEKDEPLFEISTDKVDAEIPSPVAGVLIEIMVPEGATVQINTVVAMVADSGEHEGPGTRDQGSAAVAVASVSSGTDIVMPQMGESIFEGTITKWLKKVGEPVEKDEPLFEVSTDKVDAEIPSSVAGVLTEIKIAEGETVTINTVVAVIGGTGPASPATASAQVAATSQAIAANPAETQPAVQINASGRLRSSPLVRRIAKENNLDLRQVAGTGSEGRITKEDVLGYLAQPAAARSAAPRVAPPQVAQELVPMTKMRAIIAQRMVESMQIAPHVHVVYKVDMTRIVRLRERDKAGFEQRHGVKLTYMPFIAAAAVQALSKFPIVNASLEGGSIRYHQNINLGIAVALEWGLIVPVINQAEARSFPDLARAIADLAGRARSKKLMPNEVGGSTFTLTNSGVFGDEFGTPIINQPESAILAIGSLRKEPVVRTDAEGNDTIGIGSMQHFCLGFDHRLIDGADGGKFMSEFKKTLESWDRAIR
jgi:2-oxoglutarate dehydrogenase E2 component (dihydrolipoamide succinyltransferase)